MAKKKASLHVETDLSDVFIQDNQTKARRVEGYSVDKALLVITRQMKATGLRRRTISDYELYVTHFVGIAGVQVAEETIANHIYEWLLSMDVKRWVCCHGSYIDWVVRRKAIMEGSEITIEYGIT